MVNGDPPNNLTVLYIGIWNAARAEILKPPRKLLLGCIKDGSIFERSIDFAVNAYPVV